MIDWYVENNNWLLSLLCMHVVQQYVWWNSIPITFSANNTTRCPHFPLSHGLKCCSYCHLHATHRHCYFAYCPQKGKPYHYYYFYWLCCCLFLLFLSIMGYQRNSSQAKHIALSALENLQCKHKQIWYSITGNVQLQPSLIQYFRYPIIWFKQPVHYWAESEDIISSLPI